MATGIVGIHIAHAIAPGLQGLSIFPTLINQLNVAIQSTGSNFNQLNNFELLYDPGPDMTPDRQCILYVPDVQDSNGNIIAIRSEWYLEIMANFVGEYILPAMDPNNQGFFIPVDENGNFDAGGEMTPAVPYNSFNNFCFDSTQQGPLKLFVGNENGDGADKHFYNPATSTNPNDIVLTYPDNKVVDERRFMVVAKCEDPDPTTEENENYEANAFNCNGEFTTLDSYYAMVDSTDVLPGDIVRFGVYVHNNSIYPNDPNAIANNIHIELDTQTFSNNPRAYVSADQNEYHTDPYNQSSPQIGNNTMSDNTTLNSTTPFILTPIEQRAWIYNEEVSEGQTSGSHVPDLIGNSYNYNMNETGQYNLSMTVNSSIVGGEHTLDINQQAGCFEFSNWYFFDYQVSEQEDACEELDIQWMQQWPTYENLPVLRNEVIPPADGDPPVPINFSDGNDEGLYIVGETDVPLLVQVDRNGYQGDLIWELLLADAAGNLSSYQPTVEHFCSNVAMGMQQNNCVLGNVLSENNAGTTFNRITTNPNSTLGTSYQQDTFKLYSLNQQVILHIYAPEDEEQCTEAVFLPACTDMNLITPITLDELTFDPVVGIEIEVETVPEYYNGAIVFETDNSCGFFDDDNDPTNGTNYDEPIVNTSGNYETIVTYGVSDPKIAWYNIDTSEPGCSTATGDGDTIIIHAEGDKGARCAEGFTLTEPEVPACIEVDITPTSDVHIDDGTTEITANIDVTADPGWTGILQIWVCQNASNLFNCVLSLDPTATINGTPQPLLISGVQDGDTVSITVDNISNPPQSIYVNTIGTLICNADTGVEWCGDGIINDGEECDDGALNGDPNGSCSATCEEVEQPIVCEDLEIVSPINLSCDALPEQVVSSITPPGWTGQLFWSSPDPLTTFDTDPTCSAPSSTVTTTADGLGNGLDVYVCSCDYSVDIDVSVIGTPQEEAACNDTITTEPETPPAGFCGDGILDPDGADNTLGTSDDEFCDDGNTINGDGCDEFCQLETPPAGFCGDGILDPDGTDNIPGTADDEECDDGILDGTACNADCTIPESPPGGGGGGSSICNSLTITAPSSPNVTSFPVLLQIETNPNGWAETNTATFNYSGPGNFLPLADVGDPGIPNLLNTQSKSVYYWGSFGDTVTVEDSVHFNRCTDSIQFTQTPVPPEEVPPGDSNDGEGSGSSGGGGGNDSNNGGGGSCPGIDIITPDPKNLTEPHDYIEIISPRGTILDTGANNSNGPFKYFSANGNVKFIDLIANEAEAAIALQADLLDGSLDGNALNYGQYILSEEPNTTTSKEIYYYVVDSNGDPIETMEEPVTIFVEDLTYPGIPSCGDVIQNSLAEPIGPELEKFGWIHPTGGNTTSQSGYDVNYQITYRNNGSDITKINITDTIANTINPNNGKAIIKGQHYPTLNDFVEWSDSNDSEERLIPLDNIPGPTPGSDTWYYGNGLHWIQEGEEFNTWGGHDIQIPRCDDPVEESNSPFEIAEVGSNEAALSDEVAPPTGPTIELIPLPESEPLTYGELDPPVLCYEGRIDESEGITVHNLDENTVLKFEYEGIIQATDFFDQCTNGINPELTESFYNYALAEPLDGNYDGPPIDDSETLYATCNYSLTRNAGDVLFYNDDNTPTLNPGADLSNLTEDNIRNSDGLVLINKLLDTMVSKVWGGGVNGDITPSKCDNLDGNNIIPHLFSSFICEAYYDEDSVDPGWNPNRIEQQTDFDNLSGYEVGNNYTTLSTLNPNLPQLQNLQANKSLVDQQSTRGKIYKVQRGELRLNNGGVPIIIPENSGAMTIIVDDHLKIYDDIIYSNDTGSSDHEVSSIAFIVKGDIYIDPSVQELSGVYIAKKKDDGAGGAFRNLGGNTNVSQYQLIIRGSVFGDLQPLINTRNFIGAPILDGGNVVIRYDNRAIRNTPPGLRNEINLQWLRTGRQPLQN